MKKRVISIIALAMLLCSSSVIVSADNSISTVHDSEFSYFDASSKKDVEKTVIFNSKKRTVQYARTENLKQKPVSKRADSYGTYDVYIDDQNIEFLYLLNTNLLCGMFQSSGSELSPNDVVDESKARSIALEFLSENREDSSLYEFLSCEYDCLSFKYEIQYYKLVNGYRTDDIFRIWIEANGNISYFSEFNLGRYDHLKIDAQEIKDAEIRIAEQIKNAIGVEYEIDYSCITITDEGKPALEQGIFYKERNEDIPEGYMRATIFQQPF